jgi:hypothetical protein
MLLNQKVEPVTKAVVSSKMHLQANNFVLEAIERTPLGYVKPLPFRCKVHPTSAVHPEEDSKSIKV